MRRTATWPLTLVYGVLVVYASLYPFVGWRSQGLSPWLVFVDSPVPRAASFDLEVNVAGYVPLGWLLCLGFVRSWQSRWAPVWATVLAALLSLGMETLQIYLPTRVPSVLDLALNTLGAALGALLAWALERLGVLARWSHFRAAWFVPEARGGLVLLALWPAALLFPAPVPMGLGQFLAPLTQWIYRLELQLELVDDTPLVPPELPSLTAHGIGLGVVLGVLMPGLLVATISLPSLRRVLLLLSVAGVGVGMTALSTTFSYGPLHTWGWLTTPVQAGLAAGLLLALAASRLSLRASVVALLLVLLVQMWLLNSVSPGPYLDQTLQRWEQGRWIHFYGLAQWLGWLWPPLALVYALLRLRASWPKTRMAA